MCSKNDTCILLYMKLVILVALPLSAQPWCRGQGAPRGACSTSTGTRSSWRSCFSPRGQRSTSSTCFEVRRSFPSRRAISPARQPLQYIENRGVKRRGEFHKFLRGTEPGGDRSVSSLAFALSEALCLKMGECRGIFPQADTEWFTRAPTRPALVAAQARSAPHRLPLALR